MSLVSNGETNFRLCRLCVWPNYEGFGFRIEYSPSSPHLVRLVRSNSPAAAGGLKIRDIILAVNQHDVSNADHDQVVHLIQTKRESNFPLELLVIEQRFYQKLKKTDIAIHSVAATIRNTLPTMPIDYLQFPKHQPRTCEIRITKPEKEFGLEIVNGENDIGAYIQEVFPNTPASRTSLRKSDRIIEIDGKLVDGDRSESIRKKLSKAEAKGAVKLYVMDTQTYEHYQSNEISLASEKQESDKLRHWLPRNRPQSPIIKNNGISTPSNTSDVRTLPTASLFDLSISSKSEEIRPEGEDIRLCTINRVDAFDSFGFELAWYCKEQSYSLKITSDQDNLPSNAELAGIRNDDRLIEINGQNIEKLHNNVVVKLIRAIEFPQPLQMLVADLRTYQYYRQQEKPIHHGLPNVKIIPANAPTKPSSTHKMCLTLSKTDNEYHLPAFNFDQAMRGNYTEIIRIERIQNERCYTRYLAHHADFKRRLNIDTERRFYYGCPHHMVNSIIEDGFNQSFAGIHGTDYGVGIYFSTDAVDSHEYTTPNANGERCMFVARVLIGKTTRGDSSMKAPPPGFDSTTDNNHIFVIYHDAQAFAEYLITYK